MDVKKNGAYILSDAYFEKYDTGRMMDNKSSNRPHYVALHIEDTYWMVPISHKVEKYEEKIQKFEDENKECVFYHIGEFAGQKRAFLIGDMIPTTEKYILRAYTVSGRPYVIRDEDLNRKLTSKAKRYLLLVRKKKIKPYVDIFSIERDLKRKSNPKQKQNAKI